MSSSTRLPSDCHGVQLNLEYSVQYQRVSRRRYADQKERVNFDWFVDGTLPDTQYDADRFSSFPINEFLGLSNDVCFHTFSLLFQSVRYTVA